MPMHRKNKAPRSVARNEEEQWFKNNVVRKRARDKMAKASRRKNRKH